MIITRPQVVKQRSAFSPSKLRKSMTVLAAASASLLLLASCAQGPAASDPSSPPANADPSSTPAAHEPLIETSLVLGFTAGPNFAAPFAAIEEGYFAEEGLEVTIMQGGPSVEGESLVATGKTDFVFGGLPDVPGAVAQGLPLKAVLATNQLTEFGLILDADAGVKEPKDLVGKTLALSQFATPTTLFEPFLNINGVNPDDVKVESVAGSAVVSALLSGKVDGSGGGGGTYVQVLEKDPTVEFMAYSDWGVDVLGAGLVTSTKLINENPELVGAMVRAFVRGIEFTVENPEKAIEYEAKFFPDALNAYKNPADALKFVTNLTQKPYGFMPPELWTSTVDILGEYGLLDDTSNPEQYYTNEFLPEK